jgi:Spy/CpxP family protein refolding chaperone
MLRMRQQLGLSDEQVAKLTTLRSNFQKEAIRAEAEIRVLEVELDDLLDQSKVDLGRVEAAFRKEESLRVGLRLSRVKAIEAAKAILTAEQSDRLRKALESGLGMGPGMMGPGMMGPGGSGQGMMMGPQMMQQMMGGAMGQQAAAGTSASPGGEAAWKRTDATGPVTVEATLLDPGKAGDRIRVEIVLDTHSADLDGYRLESLAALRTDTGKTLQPLGVESPSGSGHHRKGILVFPARDTNGPVLAGAKALDLVVRDVGGVKERTLRWALP